MRWLPCRTIRSGVSHWSRGRAGASARPSRSGWPGTAMNIVLTYQKSEEAAAAVSARIVELGVRGARLADRRRRPEGAGHGRRPRRRAVRPAGRAGQQRRDLRDGVAPGLDRRLLRAGVRHERPIGVPDGSGCGAGAALRRADHQHRQHPGRAGGVAEGRDLQRDQVRDQGLHPGLGARPRARRASRSTPSSPARSTPT